jgi:AraC family transcriptional regulator, transcriptional activator of pobA
MDKLLNIIKLDLESAFEQITHPKDAHTHEHEELIVGLNGNLEHFIDFKSEMLYAPYISFVTKGKLHKVKPLIIDGKCDLWVIEFRSELIPEITFHLYSYYHDHANIQIEDRRAIQRIEALTKILYDEYLQPIPDFSIQKNLLGTLFTLIDVERKKTAQPLKDFQKTQNITFGNLLQIIEENFRRPEGVEFYADKLFMSVRNLNLICHQVLQQSLSDIIETRKLTEAKNLLINSEKTIAEIGFELGYNEKAYFSNVFKKKSGVTPSDFRKEMRKLIS